MIYLLSDPQGGFVAKDASLTCKACLQACYARTEIFKCRDRQLTVRRGTISNEAGTVRLCTDSNIKSARLFKTHQQAYLSVLPVVKEQKRVATRAANTLTNRLVHNVVTYNAHILQALYSLVGQEELVRTRQHQADLIEKRLDQNRKKASVLLLRILKNANLMKTEFSVFNKLYDRALTVSMTEHEIHRVVLLVFNSFWLDFIEKHVEVRMSECRHKVFIDYESTAAALAHIIDNATKYIAPSNDLSIEFHKQGEQLTIAFDMLSLKIEPDEVDTIFEEGYSGRIPTETGLAGNGIGLYMVKEMLRLNNASIRCIPNVSKRRSVYIDDVPYEHNRFEVIFSLGANR